MSQMNDGNFQQQLHSLKDRVNALTLQYSPRRARVMPAIPSSPAARSGDNFTAQLQDVKSHLNDMQASFAQYQTRMRQQPPFPQSPQTNDKMSAQSRLTLPSGPLFWQLFNSLRSDFQGLDTRVAGLEHDVDALEDRVDRLEPDRFTPATSTTSHEDSGNMQVAQKPTGDLLGASIACLPELDTDEKNAPTTMQSGRCHSRISSLQSRANDAFEWQWPASNCRNEESLPQPYTTPMYQNNVPQFYEDQGVANNSTSVYPEGVAFRDREIDRMDDQLRTVQESLRSSEALVAAQDTTMTDVRAQLDALHAENQRMSAEIADQAALVKERNNEMRHLGKELDKRGEALRARASECDSHLQTIADRDYTVRYWQERCAQDAQSYQHTIADSDRALRRWEESYNAASDAWRQENERANALGLRLDQYRSSKRAELDQIRASYEQDLANLNDFCKHKAGIITKQEQVMSRGAQLLEERDAEIDRLQRRLKVAEDNAHHEGRQQKRMGKLLDETQSELERLRSLSGVESKEVDESTIVPQEQDQVMAASTEAMDGRDALEIPGSYPRETRRAKERPRERRTRSSDPSDASEREAARTGSPRPRRLRRHDSSRHLPQYPEQYRHYRHERRPSPPPRPQRFPHRVVPKPSATDQETETRTEVPDRRRARFLDYHHPPLPAPVGSARKMASEADLRHSDSSARRSLSKHQSMQELSCPRQRLQPYVETEGESEAEREAQTNQG